MEQVGDQVTAWFRRAMTAMNAEAESGHGAQVQRRVWAAAAAGAFATPKSWEPSSVGAQRELAPLAASDSKLLTDVVALAPELPWTPSDRLDDDGEQVGLCDLFGCINLDLAGAGLMLLSPDVGYPEHQHRPAEVYLVLHGSRRWRFGGSDRYVKVDQGQVLSNSSMDIHGIEPGPEPMLALWVLMDDRY